MAQSNGRNGGLTAVIAMTLIALTLIAAAVAAIIVRPETDPIILFAGVLILITSIIKGLLGNLTAAETRLQLKAAAEETRLQLQIAAEEVRLRLQITTDEAREARIEAQEEAKDHAKKAADAIQEVSSQVGVLQEQTDGKLTELVEFAGKLNFATATLEERTRATDRATEIAKETSAAILEATITPLPTPETVHNEQKENQAT